MSLYLYVTDYSDYTMYYDNFYVFIYEIKLIYISEETGPLIRQRELLTDQRGPLFGQRRPHPGSDSYSLKTACC